MFFKKRIWEENVSCLMYLLFDNMWKECAGTFEKKENSLSLYCKEWISHLTL